MREASQTLLPLSVSGIAGRPRLSLCMIVRDNERTLPAALESIRPYVDEMIVVDTGSVDHTPEIAKSLGAKVFEFPWCDDFARARNESLKHAAGEWLFWMDSDDTISPACGRQLRALVDRPLETSPLAYVMQVHCPGPGEGGSTDVTVVDHVKLFRNLPEIRFAGRIHEQVLASIRQLQGRIEFTDIHVVHSGSDHSPEGRQRKQQRDLRLIKLELADHPQHPFHLFNLGMTLADMGQHAGAAAALRRTLEAAQPHESHVRKAYALLASSLTQLTQYAEALAVTEAGLKIYEWDAELHFRRGIVLHHLDRRDEAIAAYRAALEQDDERHFASVDPGIAGFKARHNLAVIYTELKQHDQAELQWRLAVEELPSYCAGWRGLCESLMAQRKYVTCGVELAKRESMFQPEEQAGRFTVDSDREQQGVALHLLRYELARAQGDQQLARSLLEDAQAAFPDQPEVLRAVGRFHFEAGNWRKAEVALTALTRIVPEDGAAWHNLGASLAQRGCRAEARTALQVSLRMRPAALHTRAMLESLASTGH